MKAMLPRGLAGAAKRLVLYGGYGCYCPVCAGHFRRFKTYTYDPTIKDPACPFCSSLRRTRLLWMYLQHRTDLLQKPKKVLHVAPESDVQTALKKQAHLDYLSVDIASSKAMEKMDICHIGKPDETYDVILCNHVLEHIPDDRRAMGDSRDGREWGFLPRSYILGRASFVWLSCEETIPFLSMVCNPLTIRWGRFFRGVN